MSEGKGRSQIKQQWLQEINMAKAEIVLLRVERDRYRERCERLEELARLTDPTERGDLNAPEDMLIGPICERIGYGAVMDSAMRLWRRKDPLGAHTIGPSWILWRRALEVE